jgi:hypothetical protein
MMYSYIKKYIFSYFKRYKRRYLFDENDYLEFNPDVAASIQRGEFKSGLEHFKLHGLKEGRFPGFKGFDAEIYLNKNPDLIKLIVGNREEFARRHFRIIGFHKNLPF